MERHFRGAGYNDTSEDRGSMDGTGVVSHAGSRLLADLADRATLTAALAEGLARLRKPRARHDPGWILIDVAVAVADGPPRSLTSLFWMIRLSCLDRWRRTRLAGGCLTDSTPPRWATSPGLGLLRGKSCGRSAQRPWANHSRVPWRPVRNYRG